MTPAQILAGAADLIAARGKCDDGRYRDDAGRLCAIGAMREVVFGDAYAGPCDDHRTAVDPATTAYVMARRALEARLPAPSVTYWSDMHPAEVVVAKLRATAAELETSGAPA